MGKVKTDTIESDSLTEDGEIAVQLSLTDLREPDNSISILWPLTQFIKIHGYSVLVLIVDVIKVFKAISSWDRNDRTRKKNTSQKKKKKKETHTDKQCENWN